MYNHVYEWHCLFSTCCGQKSACNSWPQHLYFWRCCIHRMTLVLFHCHHFTHFSSWGKKPSWVALMMGCGCGIFQPRNAFPFTPHKTRKVLLQWWGVHYDDNKTYQAKHWLLSNQDRKITIQSEHGCQWIWKWSHWAMGREEQHKTNVHNHQTQRLDCKLEVQHNADDFEPMWWSMTWWWC